MSVEDVINEFNQSEQKVTAIRNLAQKYNVTQYQIIELLRKFNVDNIPTILSRSEALDFDKVKAKNTVKLDESVYTRVSINKRFDEMEWNKKEVSLIEKAKALDSYVKTTYGIDSFEIYIEVMIHLIQTDGRLHLEEVLRAIKSKTKKKGFTDMLLRATERMLIEMTEPEPTTEPKPEIKEKIINNINNILIILVYSNNYSNLLK
jgi:hypothetical protein